MKADEMALLVKEARWWFRDQLHSQSAILGRALLAAYDVQTKRIYGLEQELESFKRVTVDLTQEKYAAEAKVEKLEEELSDAKHEADHWKHTLSWTS